MKKDWINKNEFFEALSQTLETVSIVTTDGEFGRGGLTVTSMCSVSAEPPSVLVCINEKSSVCDMIRRNGVMCVNILREDQANISDIFSGKLNEDSEDQFSIGEWVTASTGSPLLVNALISLDCRIQVELRHGTHFILIGNIEQLNLNKLGWPLVYRTRRYETSKDIRSFVLDNI